MKTLILYARRNVGVAALTYLCAKGYRVKVISTDKDVLWMAGKLGVEVVTLDSMGEFDLFLCVHGDKIIPDQYLVEGKMVNVHPCLYKYKGHNPIKRYIFGADTDATVESQYLIKEVDAGSVIHQENFETPVCKTYADFYNIAIFYYYKTIDSTLKKLGV